MPPEQTEFNARYIRTPEQQALLDVYKALMAEIKIRIEAIETTCMGKTTLHGAIAREVCFLQLRMVSELIALGCLIAHGEMEEAAPLIDKWNADTIIKKLDDLHPDFYPNAVKVKRKEDESAAEIERIADGVLTKPELLSLIGRCGDALHRGSLKQVLRPKAPPVLDFEDIRLWCNKIVQLLACHAILTVDRRYLITCILWNKDDGGNVHVSLGAALE